MQGTLTIRIDATLKQKAEEKAAAEDETLSQVVRRALREYVSPRHPSSAPRGQSALKSQTRITPKSRKCHSTRMVKGRKPEQ